MGAWYWIGVAAGLGAAAGVLLAGLIRSPFATVLTAFIAGAAVGYGIQAWQPSTWGAILAGLLGGGAGALGASQIVRGALRRGGTRGGTAVLVAVAAIAVACLAFVPVLGYLEALALPAVAARLRRTQPERYAGLRTLARD